MDTTRRVQRIKTRLKRNHERAQQMRHDRLRLPFAHFVLLMPYMTEETIKRLILIDPPAKFGKVDIPDNLQMVTFGTLTKLQQAAQSRDYLKTCCELVSILTGYSAERVASRPAVDVLGIVNMVQREMERIGKLFQSLNTGNTAEEQMAGADKLNFGAFGIVDWYARRMGIIDHEDVFNTPWARIFQCMKMDHEQGEYEKRYRQIITRKK